MAEETNAGNAQALAPATAKERRYAGLRPAKPGEVRNPKGLNGRMRSEVVAAFLEEQDEEFGQKMSRIRLLLKTGYIRAVKKSDAAFKELMDQYAGRARQQLDLTSSDRSMSPVGLLTTEELRKILAAQLAEPEDGKDPDGSPEGNSGTSG